MKDEPLSPTTATTSSNTNPFCMIPPSSSVVASQTKNSLSSEIKHKNNGATNAPTRPSSGQPSSASLRGLIVLDEWRYRQQQQPFQGHAPPLPQDHGRQQEHISLTLPPPIRPPQGMTPRQMKLQQRARGRRKAEQGKGRRSADGHLRVVHRSGPVGLLPDCEYDMTTTTTTTTRLTLVATTLSSLPCPLSIPKVAPHFRARKEQVIPILSTIGMETSECLGRYLATSRHNGTDYYKRN